MHAARTESATGADRPVRSAGRRARLISLAHVAAAQLGLDDATRRVVQAAHTGKASCAEMSESELVRLVWALKGLGARVHLPPPACARPDDATGRWPTAWQWVTLERVAVVEHGWDGLDDERLVRFVRRTEAVDHPRFLDRPGMSDVISGLMRWARQKAKAGGEGGRDGKA